MSDTPEPTAAKEIAAWLTSRGYRVPPALTTVGELLDWLIDEEREQARAAGWDAGYDDAADQLNKT